MKTAHRKLSRASNLRQACPSRQALCGKHKRCTRYAFGKTVIHARTLSMMSANTASGAHARKSA